MRQELPSEAALEAEKRKALEAEEKKSLQAEKRRASAAIVAEAAKALKAGTAQEKQVALLAKMLKDRDSVVRLEAAQTLEGAGLVAKAALPSLEEATNDEEEGVRRAAQRAVATIRRQASLAIVAEAVKTLKARSPAVREKQAAILAKMLKDRDSVVRLEAAQRLGDAGLVARAALPSLEDAVKDEDEAVRRAAQGAIARINVLVERRDKAIAALPPLLKDLTSEKLTTRTKAIEEIGKLGPDVQDACEPIVKALVEGRPGIKETALDALEKIHPELQKHVVALLVDQGRGTQAIKSIGELGADGRGALPLLLRFFHRNYGRAVAGPRDEFATNCTVALTVLAQIAPDDNRVVDAIIKSIDFVNPRETHFLPESEIRSLAIGLLGTVEIDADKVVPPLISAAVSDPHCRLRAIDALAMLKGDAGLAVPALKKLKRHHSADVRESAGKALEKIEGK